MQKGHFLCGCDPNDEFVRTYRAEVAPNGGLSFKRFKNGFEVCPIHGARLYGWASPMVQGPQGNNVIDYSVHRGGVLNIDWKRMKSNPDFRDNRDPEQVGRELLSKRNGKKPKTKART